ncbi:hypothetical protein PGTUg99_012605 [Puccinia graminis f. sp. tritici]|uniref:Uncharacterized protein n=1 Tax=Puccinia graminis f. sp. tritici TaxID=56615 RepID=A0A5B0P867_PUCGR|nr:hypothetical protein PGTUg99_012605 [Puccinia graminis f. sp. tritici]
MAEYEGQVTLTRSTREAKNRCVASEQAYMGAQDDRATFVRAQPLKKLRWVISFNRQDFTPNTLSRQDSAPPCDSCQQLSWTNPTNPCP